MGRITSGVGLASGINSQSIIDQLIALESRPKVALQTRIETQNKKKTAYTDLQMKLTSLRLFGTTIKKPQTFRAANVNSSDEGVVTGTASTGAAAGSYRMSVARLVTAQQSVSKGFADFDTTKVGASTITMELGGGDLNTPTRLDDLNGGDGIRRGQFRIIDRAGNSTIIDTSDAVTLEDVLKKINTSLDVSVKASISNNAIVLTDTTGQSSNNFRVQDVGDGHSAEDLGIVANSGSASITGTQIGKLSLTTPLSRLNDGRGVAVSTSALAKDLKVTMGDGTEHEVSLMGTKTVGDVITKINSQIGGQGYASIASNGRGISIVDTSVDYDDPLNPVSDPMTVEALNGNAASQLGLIGTANASGAFTGSAVTAGLDNTLISSLNGGSGMTLGTISITDRAGTQRNIDLSGAVTLNDMLERINSSGVDVLAEVKPGANGISLTDQTGKGGYLSISDVSGTTAASLGIDGAFAPDEAHKTISGKNLQKAWFTTSTLLRDLNGGKGVPDGSFKISDSTGKTKTISIDAEDDASIADVIDKINADTTFGVKASINANGDGLLLTDTAGGSLIAKVEDQENGTAAKSLNVLGSFTGTTLNGSWEKTVAITATDTLDKVLTKINDLNWGISASIINDGSGNTPYRLSLTATNTGRAGRVAFSSTDTTSKTSVLGDRVLVDAQDAAVFVGSDSSAQPLLITSSSNVVSGAIRGVTLNLNGVSKEPVSVNVARNVDNVVESANKFVENFNGLVTQLKEYTKFDSTTNTRGDLLGDPVAQSVESELYGILTTVGNETGKYRIASDVGLRVGEGGMIEFDEQKFRDAYADDPDAVTTLFTRAGGSMDADYLLQDLRSGQGIRSATTGDDFSITAKDGTTFNIDVGELSTMGQIIDAINDATVNNGKVTASINSSGTGINLIDHSTTGTKTFTVSSLNGSAAAIDLGLVVSSSRGQIQGRSIINVNAGNRGGIGSIIEKRINRLIDPVSGVVTRSSKESDSRTDEFNNRIESIDKLVAIKRARLERQFANLESSLSSLQGQQSALNSFTPVSLG